MPLPTSPSPPTLPVFDGFDTQSCQTVTDLFESQRWQRGEYLFVEGNDDKHQGAMVIICTGVVWLERNVANGPNRRVATLNAGSVFGETSLIVGGPHTVSAVAGEAVEALVLYQRAFDELRSEHPDIALALTINLARTLTVRLRAMNDLVSAHLAEEADVLSVPSDLDQLRHQVLHEWQL